MIKYLIENGFPVNLTSTREEVNGKIWSDIKVYSKGGKELYSISKRFDDNEERKSYISGMMKGMEIALR